jgi:methyl-accepting chemotaxis protein
LPLKVFWTLPYHDVVAQVPLISATVPLSDNKGVMGVAFVDLSLERLEGLAVAMTASVPGSKVLVASLPNWEVIAQSGLPQFAPEKVATPGGPEDFSIDTKSLTDFEEGQAVMTLTAGLLPGMVKTINADIGGEPHLVMVYNLNNLFGFSLMIPHQEIFKEAVSARDIGRQMLEEQARDIKMMGLEAMASMAVLALALAVMGIFVIRVTRLLRTAAESLMGQVGEVAAMSDRLANLSDSLEADGKVQGSLLIETAGSIKVISAKLHETADDTRRCGEAMDRASAQVVNGSGTVSGMKRAMDQIANASAEVAKILGDIEAIAFQTNLLALNASVEASRAGEAGQGFAVVAEEVRNLAGATKESAQRTSTLLDEALKRTRQGLSATENLSSSFAGIEDVFREAQGMMRSISQASSEQTGTVDGMVRNVVGLDSLVKHNTDVVHQTKTNSGELFSQASLLQKTARLLLSIIDGGPGPEAGEAPGFWPQGPVEPADPGKNRRGAGAGPPLAAEAKAGNGGSPSGDQL